MERSINNNCPHILNSLTPVTKLFALDLKKIRCEICFNSGPNLWICLHENCLQTGCSEQVKDHSTQHFKLNNDHCVHMNLSSQRTWCYLCESEIFLPHQRNFFDNIAQIELQHSSTDNQKTNQQKTKFEIAATSNSMYGLIGLQNIANTCYMNSALQALCHIPELTNYFLDCGHILDDLNNTKKCALSRSYCNFIRDAWSKNKKNKDYIIPIKILSNIRSVYPMFRGFQQHDTQEFLRCFMDQLHEELKETFPSNSYILQERFVYENNSDGRNLSNSSSPSQSEAEYETCDSGVSEPLSLFDEASISSSSHRFKLAENCQRSSKLHNEVPSLQNLNCFTYQELPSTEQQQKSIISDIFDGKLLSSVQCLTCDLVSIKEETFQDLSLPIPSKDHLAVLHNTQGMITSNVTQLSSSNSYSDAVHKLNTESWLWWMWIWLRSWFYGPAVTLHDCLASFFSADELKGDNMYSCDKCSKLRNGMKYSRVVYLPEVLCVHLKRFRHDLSYSSKISSYIYFPLNDLDMRPFIHKDCKSTISLYNLVSVICHHGTVGGGHYTSFAKHGPSGKWFEFDDQYVREVTPETVQSCQAYVLFYRKNNPQMSIIREEAHELANSQCPNSDIRFFISRQWINRFQTFAEPGLIDNWSILCPHGGLPPGKISVIDKLAIPISQFLWDYLYKRYGGGPVCNRLYECDICKRAEELLSRRQRSELETFSQYNDDFQNDEDDQDSIYAISMAWFRQWQLFARGLTQKEPPPVNNASIACTSELSPISTVKQGSDYAQLNKNLWNFFFNIYGGGPEIILRESIRETRSQVIAPHEVCDIRRNRKHSNSDGKYAENDKNAFRVSSTKTTEDNEIEDIMKEEEQNISENPQNNSGTANVVGSKKVKIKNVKQTHSRKQRRNHKHDSSLFNHKYNNNTNEQLGFFGPEGNYFSNPIESEMSSVNLNKERELYDDANGNNISIEVTTTKSYQRKSLVTEDDFETNGQSKLLYRCENFVPAKEGNVHHRNHRKKSKVKVSTACPNGNGSKYS